MSTNFYTTFRNVSNMIEGEGELLHVSVTSTPYVLLETSVFLLKGKRYVYVNSTNAVADRVLIINVKEEPHHDSPS